ncbi:GEVED domain-containing protein [Chryseobacterium sp. IT-36CA2]|uniref:GEVED domain-containing protein n=1 Tax=Chryseobacterium sp. IT-36CA2 TaxID=3026460 RepID=UPI0039E1E291
MKKTILCGILLLSLSVSAQQKKDWCDFDNEQRVHQKQNSEIDEMIRNIRNRVISSNQNTTAKNGSAYKIVDGVYEIPVVVHVITPTGAALGTAYNKTDAQIQAWLDHCNQMYAGTYQWAQGVPADFGNAATMPIKLVLAKRDPNCNATTGIVRYNGGALPGYDANGVNRSGTAGVTTTQIKSIAPHWPEASYFNIYIMNKVDGGGQYGIMGWAGLPQNPDSSYESFMKSFVVTLQDDITLAHEFGHSMGLLHTFGNANAQPPQGDTTTTNCPATTGNCATDDDQVCDTERSRSLLSDFPAPTNSSMNYCTGTNYQGVQYNMMNYTNPIAFKFTSGQHDRAALYFFLLRGALSTSLGATAPTAAASVGTPIAATCNPSGILNTTSNYFVGPTLVKLGAINNGSVGYWQGAPVFYEDYTGASCLKATSTELLATGTHNLQVNVTDSNNDVRVWIDYNNNGTFEASELVASADNIIADPVTAIGTYSTTITAPASAVLNTPLRMRVLVDDENPNMTPCGQLKYGQVEDYTVKFVTNLGTSEVKADNSDLTVYPNPVSTGDKIFIKAKNVKNLKVSISDMSGRLVSSPSVTEEGNGVFKVDQQLEKGVYMIQVSNGKDSKSSKLIIK